jgi:SAM-dependent methyltransferase
LAIIAPTIIPAVNASDELAGFYDEAYSQTPADAERYSRWRALGAIGKADHVVHLCRRARLAPASVLEVGCGDGALLSELHRRGFAPRLCGLEITERAVAIARARAGIASVDVYDGQHVPFASGAFELGILSHVLEHVRDPAALLAETARACHAVVIEVPLEANWSARRPGKRAHAAEVGHLQRLDRAAARSIVEHASLRVLAELEDPLPLRVHSFAAAGLRSRAAAWAKWALRAGTHRLAPPLARRAFTLHYAALCVPLSAASARAPRAPAV